MGKKMATKGRKKIERIQEQKENAFYEAKVPEFKHLTVKVNTKIKTEKKGDELLSYKEDFTINIEINDIIKSKVIELKKELESICRRTLYLNSGKYFSYYTYDMEEEEKKVRFKAIIDCLQNFEKNYKPEELINIKEQQEFLSLFNAENNYRIEYKDLMIVYLENQNLLAIIAKEYLGKEEYIKLVNPSISRDKVKFTILADFLEKKYLNKAAFIYSINDYDFVKSQVKSLEERKDIREKQEILAVINDKDKFEALNYSKKNFANFFIEFNEEKKGFYFYLLGYKQKSTYGRYSDYLSSLEEIVKEIVVVQDRKSDLKKEEFEEYIKKFPYKVREEKIFSASLNGEIIPEVEIIKDKSERMRWFVPVSSYNELKIIRDSFIKNEKLFIKKVMPANYQFSQKIYSPYPIIDENGDCYIAFSKKLGVFDKQIQLSFPEFKDFKALMSEKSQHAPYLELLWNEKLYYSSKHLSAEGADMDKVLEDSYRRAELRYSLEEIDGNKKVAKKRKI